MKILKTINGETVHLLKDRVTEPKGTGAYGQTFYALFSDIKEAHKNNFQYVFVKELKGNDSERPFGPTRGWDDKHLLGLPRNRDDRCGGRTSKGCHSALYILRFRGQSL